MLVLNSYIIFYAKHNVLDSIDNNFNYLKNTLQPFLPYTLFITDHVFTVVVSKPFVCECLCVDINDILV